MKTVIIQYEPWVGGMSGHRWVAYYESDNVAFDYGTKDSLVREAIEGGNYYKVMKANRNGKRVVAETNVPHNADIILNELGNLIKLYENKILHNNMLNSTSDDPRDAGVRDGENAKYDSFCDKLDTIIKKHKHVDRNSWQ